MERVMGNKSKMDPKILAVETSGTVCSVALSTGDFMGEYTLEGNNLHDKFLAKLTDRILEDAGIKADDLTHIAVSAGPGSFTGLRIGASLVKGLCFENKAKLIPIPTLDAYAFLGMDVATAYETDIVAVIPSHKNLFYYQKYSNELEKITNIIIEDREKLDDIAEGCIVSSPNNKMITAKSLLECLEDNFYEPVEASVFEPMYIQEFKPNTSKKDLNI